VFVDFPARTATVTRPFIVAGWALDTSSI